MAAHQAPLSELYWHEFLREQKGWACRQRRNSLPAFCVLSDIWVVCLKYWFLGTTHKDPDPIWDKAPEGTPSCSCEASFVRVAGHWTLVDLREVCSLSSWDQKQVWRAEEPLKFLNCPLGGAVQKLQWNGRCPTSELLKIHSAELAPKWGFCCGFRIAKAKNLHEAISSKYEVLIRISLLILTPGETTVSKIGRCV